MSKNRQSPHLKHVGILGATQGIAAVEFALVAPVLILLFSGAISYGVALRLKMEVGNAARAGATYAATHPFNLPNITTAARGATVLSTVTVTAVQVTASCVNPTTGVISGAGSAATCPLTGAAPGTYTTVTTQMPYDFILPPVGMAESTTLSGKAVSRTR